MDSINIDSMTVAARVPGSPLFFYGYIPNLSAGLIFAIIFGLLSITHLILAIKVRRKWFGLIVIGSLMELTGFSGRIWSHYNLYSNVPYLIQILSLIIAPSFISAGIYLFLGNLIQIDRKASRISPRSYVTIFVTCDVVGILVQAIGGAVLGIAVQEEKDTSMGLNILVGGIVFQLLATVIFFILFLDFYSRISFSQFPTLISKKLRRLAYGIGATAIFIIIRGIYRSIELKGGINGELLIHEPYFFCLDAVPMVLALTSMVICHPYFTVVSGGTVDLGPPSTYSFDKEYTHDTPLVTSKV